MWLWDAATGKPDLLIPDVVAGCALHAVAFHPGGRLLAIGGIDWLAHAQTADWYRKFKSRPSFRPLLAERMEVIKPPSHYEEADF